MREGEPGLGPRVHSEPPGIWVLQPEGKRGAGVQGNTIFITIVSSRLGVWARPPLCPGDHSPSPRLPSTSASHHGASVCSKAHLSVWASLPSAVDAASPADQLGPAQRRPVFPASAHQGRESPGVRSSLCQLLPNSGWGWPSGCEGHTGSSQAEKPGAGSQELGRGRFRHGSGD